jgi:hypothetical protein
MFKKLLPGIEIEYEQNVPTHKIWYLSGKFRFILKTVERKFLSVFFLSSEEYVNRLKYLAESQTCFPEDSWAQFHQHIYEQLLHP